jgi:hypothetical protein
MCRSLCGELGHLTSLAKTPSSQLPSAVEGSPARPFKDLGRITSGLGRPFGATSDELLEHKLDRVDRAKRNPVAGR